MSVSDAWWRCACAVLALAGASARLYERCDLAADLQSLDMRPEHVSTWICIAYHESRFDTAAYNPYSGDHGLLQISEQYWCGPGNVCGVPCSAFRDDDISDDVECAKRIYEEHTALQGDGFLAWVVYAQYCKNDTEEYLSDCDTSSKNISVHSMNKQKNLTQMNEFNSKTSKLPYSGLNSLLRGYYGNEFETRYEIEVNRKNWLDVKVSNINELTIPKFPLKITKKVSTPAKSATLSTASPTTTSEYRSTTERHTLFNTGNTKTQQSLTIKSAYKPFKYLSTKWPFTLRNSINKEYKTTTVRPESVTSTSAQTSSVSTTRKPFRLFATTRPWISRTSSELSSRTTALSTSAPQLQAMDKSRKTNTLLPVPNRMPATGSSVFDLQRNPTKRNFTFPQTSSTSSIKPFTVSTKEPWFLTKTSTAAWSRIDAQKTTHKPRLFNQYSVTSRITTHKPRVLNEASVTSRMTTLKPRVLNEASVTSRMTTLKPRVLNRASVTSQMTTTPLPTTQKLTSTTSIFDLYLNPTKRSQIKYQHNLGFSNSKYKLQIFSDGTTSTPSNRV